MAIATYSDLQATISSWLHDRADMVPRVPDFISLGEAYLNRTLRGYDMEAQATITPPVSGRSVALPPGYMEMISFVDHLGMPLHPVDAEEIDCLAFGLGPTQPLYFYISSDITFEAPADQAYIYNMRYMKRLNLAADLTNSIIAKHPDCYLYASLVHSAPYLKDDARVTLWKSMLDAATTAVNAQAIKRNQQLRTEFRSFPFNITRGY